MGGVPLEKFPVFAQLSGVVSCIRFDMVWARATKFGIGVLTCYSEGHVSTVSATPQMPRGGSGL